MKNPIYVEHSWDVTHALLKRNSYAIAEHFEHQLNQFPMHALHELKQGSHINAVTFP